MAAKQEAGEEEKGIDALAEDEEHPVGGDGAGRAAEVLDRFIGIDGMAGPIGGMEAADGQETKPGAGGDPQIPIQCWRFDRFMALFSFFPPPPPPPPQHQCPV